MGIDSRDFYHEMQARQRSAATGKAPKFGGQKAKVLERDITKAIRNTLAALKIYHWKEHGGLGSFPGVADIIGVHPGNAQHPDWKGRIIAIEVKTATGKLSDAQVLFLNNVRESGGFAIVARSVDDVISALDAGGMFLFSGKA